MSIMYLGLCAHFPTKFHPDPSLQAFSKILGSPLQLPPMSPDLVGILNMSPETRYPSEYQISFRSDHPFVSSKKPKFFRINTFSNSTKQSGFSPVMSIIIPSHQFSWWRNYSSHQVSSSSQHSKRFPRFPPPPTQ